LPHSGPTPRRFGPNAPREGSGGHVIYHEGPGASRALAQASDRRPCRRALV